ncbi:MAG: restriction endonuclease [bacterium]|nr:restriction endonuclease [bacterium]
MPSLYCIRAEGGEFTEAFVQGGYAAIGFDSPDLTPYIEGEDKEVLRRDFAAAHPDRSSRLVAYCIWQLWRFATELQKGDLILTPERDTERLRVGAIAGDYYYERKEDPQCNMPHRRNVKWEERVLLRSTLSVPMQNTLRASLTLYTVMEEVDPSALFEALQDPEKAATLLGVEKPSHARTHDVLYEAVLDRILELDPEEFEVLVTELLSTLGFEAQHVGRARDGGIDAVGTLDVFGMARVELQVQCKRYHREARISAKQVRDFRGAVPENSQACFITTAGYAKNTWEEATREGFKRIGLINGRQLVDILTEKYHDLPTELKDRLNLRLALFPE